jgi:hypothetical protein
MNVLIVPLVAVSLHQTASAQTLRWQVAVDPSTNLQDGQTVLVQGTGWVPYSRVTIQQCRPGTYPRVTDLHTACEFADREGQARVKTVPTGAGGDFQAYFDVHRTIHVRTSLNAPFTTSPYTCEPTCNVQVVQYGDEAGVTRGHAISFAEENPIAAALRNLVNSVCGVATGPFCDALRAIVDALLPTIQPPPPPPPTTTTTTPPVTTPPPSTTITAPPATLAPIR